MKKIQYPYLPEGREIMYVGLDNKFMKEAHMVAQKYRGSLRQPNGVVLVKDGVIIGRGSIGMGYHFEHGCERIKHNMPTGIGYDLCPGCHTDNHGEAQAIRNAKENDHDTKGADLYLWGHWWYCQHCWDKMIKAGIRDVYLLKNSEILFNKEHPDNIIGHSLNE